MAVEALWVMGLDGLEGVDWVVRNGTSGMNWIELHQLPKLRLEKSADGNCWLKADCNCWRRAADHGKLSVADGLRLDCVLQGLTEFEQVGSCQHTLEHLMKHYLQLCMCGFACLRIVMIALVVYVLLHAGRL